MRITRENTTGLIIDIQERLFPAMNNKETLLKNAKVLVKGLQVLGISTVFTQQYTRGLGKTLDEISSLVPGFTYFEKSNFSSFDVPEYQLFLEQNSCENVIIAGIESHVCVLQTAVDLKHAGYNPIVVMDCTDSRTEANKQLAMERFRSEGILMTSYESILFELTASAKAPEFKTISNLIK
jgi:nicotinamidase-related amidase